MPERQEVDWDGQSQNAMETIGRDAFRNENVDRGPEGAVSQAR